MQGKQWLRGAGEFNDLLMQDTSPKAVESPASDGEQPGTPMLQVLTDAKGRIVAMAAVQEANRGDDVDYRIVAGRGQALAEVSLPRALLSSDGSFDAERLVTRYKLERTKRSVMLVAASSHSPSSG